MFLSGLQIDKAQHYSQWMLLWLIGVVFVALVMPERQRSTMLRIFVWLYFLTFTFLGMQSCILNRG